MKLTERQIIEITIDTVAKLSKQVLQPNIRTNVIKQVENVIAEANRPPIKEWSEADNHNLKDTNTSRKPPKTITYNENE